MAFGVSMGRVLDYAIRGDNSYFGAGITLRDYDFVDLPAAGSDLV